MITDVVVAHQDPLMDVRVIRDVVMILVMVVEMIHMVIEVVVVN
jgi:hypothetical protein